MNSKFKFDRESGTMVPVNDGVAQGLKADVQNSVHEIKKENTQQIDFKDVKKIEVKEQSTPNVQENKIIQMKRVDKQTPVQLVNERGIPESYLDTTSSVIMFREGTDYNVWQIIDEKTRKPLCYIGGYALAMNFNMPELRTHAQIEKCLDGIVKLFRHKLMNQSFPETKAD